MRYKVGDYVEIKSGPYSWHRAEPKRVFIGKISLIQNNGLFKVFVYGIYSNEDKWLYSKNEFSRKIPPQEIFMEAL